MKTIKHLVPVAVAATLLMSLGERAQATESGCVVCHTDADKIKSLYKPPEIKFEFDEGEG
jgi:hypothetical protein